METPNRTTPTPTSTTKLQQTVNISERTPSIFPNCPKYLSKSCSKIRKSREDKRRESDENNLLMAINESKASFIAYTESISFRSFDRLLEIIDSFPPKQNWLKISDESKVTFFKIDYNPGPSTNYSVVINANLNMEIYTSPQN
jgi:hypothetical protein